MTNERGSISAPLVLALIAITLAGMGTWGVMRHWRKLVETQLRLDQCTGEAALTLKAVLQAVERENAAIHATRASIAVAQAANPPAVPALEGALTVLVAKQEIDVARWKAAQVAWWLKRGCGSPGDLAPPLPELRWERGIPDTLGPQALEWVGPMPGEFRILARHAPRTAAAHVKGEGNGIHHWKAEWCSVGTSLL
ncbi:MAG: hypothetical protein ACXWP5_11870 [Bdellovibrionota bacterium]